MTTVTSDVFGDIEFFDELPSKSIIARIGPPFTDILRAHPQRWAAWPTTGESKSPSPKSLNSIATQIRHGTGTFKEGEFEAAVRRGVLYVRYIGESPRPTEWILDQAGAREFAAWVDGNES